jgi:hypothetical protein
MTVSILVMNALDSAVNPQRAVAVVIAFTLLSRCRLPLQARALQVSGALA